MYGGLPNPPVYAVFFFKCQKSRDRLFTSPGCCFNQFGLKLWQPATMTILQLSESETLTQNSEPQYLEDNILIGYPGSGKTHKNYVVLVSGLPATDLSGRGG